MQEFFSNFSLKFYQNVILQSFVYWSYVNPNMLTYMRFHSAAFFSLLLLISLPESLFHDLPKQFYFSALIIIRFKIKKVLFCQ